MGSLLLVLGPSGDPGLGKRLGRMIARSPHRGEESFYETAGLSLAVQSLGWDASMAHGKNVVVAFHGFVGNWGELRLSHGLRFDAGASHAEIIAAVFEDLDEGIIPLLRGEFAVVIHDLRRNRVLAARDPVGCRPLYMQDLGDRVLVASEIRQVVAGSDRAARPNTRGFAAHLLHEPPVESETLVEGIDCVMPGEIFTFSPNSSGIHLSRTRYWGLEEALPEPIQDMADWLDELELRLRRATRRWLPKHPSGLALSGGLDSSALWAEVVALREEGLSSAKSVRPVSLFFPGYPCDERLFVERTLQDTGDRVLAIDGTRETALSLRPKLLRRLDTVPFSTSYTVQLMAEAAAIDGRLTLMTGHLGDHFFDHREPGFKGRTGRFLRVVLNATLGRHWAPRVYSALRRQTLSKAHKSDLDLLQKEWRTEISRRRWNRGLRRFSPTDVISNRLRSERTGWSLQSWEQICAGFGVEVRHPFSDPDLIAFAASVPRSLCASGLTKPVLRAVYRQRLPRMIVDRRDKITFDCLAQRDSPSLASTVPPTEWFLVTNGIINPMVLDSLLVAANNDEEARKTVLRVEAVESCAQLLMLDR